MINVGAEPFPTDCDTVDKTNATNEIVDSWTRSLYMLE